MAFCEKCAVSVWQFRKARCQIAMLRGKPGNSQQVDWGLREGLPSACEQVRTSCGQGEKGKGEGQNHKKLWNNFVDFFRKMRII